MAANQTFPVPVANLRQHSSAFPTVAVEEDSNQSKYTATYANAATQRLHGVLWIPPNYTGAGGVNFLWSWRSSVNTGNVTFEVKTVVIATAGTCANGGAETQTASAATAAPGTVGYSKNESFGLATGVDASDVMAFALSRLGSDAGDTCTGTATLLDLSPYHVIDATIKKRYAWACSQAINIPTASGATRSTTQWGATIFPECVALRDAQSDYCEVKFRVPSNYNGNLKTTLVESGLTATGAFVWRIDAAKIGLGTSIDPTFTQGTQFTSGAHAANTTLRIDLERDCPIAVSAGDTVIFRIYRLGSDGSDANTGSAAVWGLGLTYDIVFRAPAEVMLDPTSGVAPASGGCDLLQRTGTNVTDWVAAFSNGADETLDLTRMVPVPYSSGGTLHIEWDSPAASGDAKFRVDYAYVSNNSESANKVLTAGTAITSTTAGANLRNRVSVNVASGGSQQLIGLFRLTRLGADAADTCEDVVNVTNLVWESTPAAP